MRNPYLRFDNDLVLEEGMSFSIEPGIYIPELGGFRHSDTVILTKGGSRKDYPVQAGTGGANFLSRDTPPTWMIKKIKKGGARI